MILVLDTGNTNIVLGVYEQGQLKHHWRMETYRHKTEDEYAMQVKSLFSHVGLSFEDSKRHYYFFGCTTSHVSARTDV